MERERDERERDRENAVFKNISILENKTFDPFMRMVNLSFQITQRQNEIISVSL